MGLYNSEAWIKDIDQIIENMPWLKSLSGNSILITGAGGLICSSVIDVLIRYNEMYAADIIILAAARSEEKIRNRFGIYFDKKYFKFVPYDAINPTFYIEDNADYIVHGASNASPNSIVKEPVETMMSNFTGLLGLLNYGANSKTKRLLYISSSEVYGRKNENKPFKEDNYGYVDLLNSRNSYSVGKRAAETLCAAYFDEYNLDTVIVRPGHIYGPTASKKDNRVSSQWPYAVARGEDIIMKSRGSQIRSYCYCLDCASAVLTVLMKGNSKTAYNISNPYSIVSIKQMAEILTRYGNVNLQIEEPTAEEKKGFNPMENSSLDASMLIDLGWRGCFTAEEGLSHTVQIIKEIEGC